MNVLIVEDEAVTRAMLESLLPLWGYEVTTATDGLEAWDHMQRADAPRLAIVDWQIPGIDGLELTRLLRGRVDAPYVHLLMLTSRDSTADLVVGMDAGADDYLAKPFDPNELRVRLAAARRSIGAQDQVTRLAAELERKNRKLAALTDTAHRFVDNVSHEFRTPLTVIKEFTSIVSDGLAGPVSDTQQEYLQLVTNAVNDLTQMVDDLLDSSKLKAGTLRIDRCPQSVADIVAFARPLVQGKAAARRIRIEQRLEDGLPEVLADREKVVRILVNLLVNAIKFSPEDSTVTICVETGDENDVRIVVEDEGPGMTPEELSRIFERFTQVGSVSDTSRKGFGLGLSIARELVWLNLGTIGVQSTPGAGTAFSFTLPRHKAGTIVSHYFRRIAELPDRAGRCVVLRVTPPAAAASDPATLEGLRDFLASSCYPTDLIIPATDGASVLVAGLCDAPQHWADRLAARARESAVVPTPGIEIVDVRPYPDEAADSERTLRSILGGRTIHAG